MKPNQLIVSEMGPFVMSPARFKSLYEPGTSEDMFPYYNPRAQWKLFSRITKPLLICVGAKDEWLDRPVKKYIQAFVDHAPEHAPLQTAIIAGANHGYKKREQILAKTLIQWIQTL